MRITRVILIYVACVFLAAAMVAYPVYLGFTSVGLEVPFHKLVTRLLKLFALVGLWPLLGFLRINQRIHWGFGLRRVEFLGALAKGFGIGVAILAVLVTPLFVLGARAFDQPLEISSATVSIILLKGMVAGLVVGMVEEAWFRGALFSALLKFGNSLSAIFVTAGLYALVHFIRADVPVAPIDVTWNSGFSVIAHSFGRFGSRAIVDSCLALFAAGVFLSLIRHHTGNIALCIGIHAGWVTVIKSVKSVSQVDRGSEWFFLVGSYDGVIGILAVAWLTVLAMTYYWFVVNR